MPIAFGARYKNQITRPFLRGLLSDNERTLSPLAARYSTSARNPMALLHHVGRDTAGALQLLPAEAASDDAAARASAIQFVDDFDGLISEMHADAESWIRDRDGIRWSLAGAQPKLALYRAPDGRWAVPLDSTPTTHILKPAASGDRYDLDEFLTMRAARHLRLDVADHEVITTGRRDHVFISKRFDRVLRDGRLHRLHQEDLAQALAVDPALKYQADGGPGLGDFARLLSASPLSQQRKRDVRYSMHLSSPLPQSTPMHTPRTTPSFISVVKCAWRPCMTSVPMFFTGDARPLFRP